MSNFNNASMNFAASLDAMGKKAEACAIRLESISFRLADLMANFGKQLTELDIDALAKLKLSAVVLTKMSELKALTGEIKAEGNVLKQIVMKIEPPKTEQPKLMPREWGKVC